MSKLLVVEDDEQLLFILSKSLENVGHLALVATNGEQAINLLNQHPDIDLVITDLLMPVVDGVQLCNYIRNEKAFENIPILIITGQTDIYYKCQGFDAGADDFISKPIEFVEFMLRVKALLKRRQRNVINPESQEQGISGDNLPHKQNESENFFSFNTKMGIPVIIDKNNSTIVLGNQEIYLTSTELDIISYLYKKKKEATNSEELLEKMMNYPPGSGNPVAIRTHIRNIRSKIEKDPNNPEIIINIPKRGYILNIDYK
jgi:two-component system OmpR family response regulator